MSKDRLREDKEDTVKHYLFCECFHHKVTWPWCDDIIMNRMLL